MKLPTVRKAILWLGSILVAVFLLLQVKQVDRTNPPVESEISAPAEIAAILERSCYACHSNETAWPWYSYLAPVSWWLVDHVEEGRGEINFSSWALLAPDAQQHALHEIDEEIAKGAMPLPKYLLLHPEARLSDADKQALRNWARVAQANSSE